MGSVTVITPAGAISKVTRAPPPAARSAGDRGAPAEQQEADAGTDALTGDRPRGTKSTGASDVARQRTSSGPRPSTDTSGRSRGATMAANGHDETAPIAPTAAETPRRRRARRFWPLTSVTQRPPSGCERRRSCGGPARRRARAAASKRANGGGSGAQSPIIRPPCRRPALARRRALVLLFAARCASVTIRSRRCTSSRNW